MTTSQTPSDPVSMTCDHISMDGRVRLTTTPLNPTEVESLVLSPDRGGVLTFTGRVRDHNQGEGVLHLEYEAYEEMALKELELILREAEDRFKEAYAAVHHRLGHLEIGDVAVVVSVASAHRGVTFTACEWIIDTLKARVPIFKHERRTNGKVWVGLGP